MIQNGIEILKFEASEGWGFFFLLIFFLFFLKSFFSFFCASFCYSMKQIFQSSGFALVKRRTFWRSFENSFDSTAWIYPEMQNLCLNILLWDSHNWDHGYHAYELV